ncbi:MAG TPA: S53 family peptidase [Streptosporangiaceae bacterium]|jgi:kumamolisin
MGVIHRPVRAATITLLGLAMTAAAGAFASSAKAAGPAAARGMVALRGSMTPNADVTTGPYRSARMSVELALAPRDPAGLNAELKAVYTKGSGRYQHWLAKGQFDARYAPAAAARAAVTGYLTRSGLTVRRSSSPFLVRVTGSSQQVSAAFGTTLRSYTAPGGTRFFANSTAARLPGALASRVLGVIGLANTAREHDMIKRPEPGALPAARPAARPQAPPASCEAPYPTAQQLFDFFATFTPFPDGYAGGPGCSGLTPSQLNSIYGAPQAGRAGQGAGTTLAVFELSGYLESDISTYAHTFLGPGFTPRLENVNVDGGPVTPACPAGDTCPPELNGFAADIEVDADVETQLAIAPDVSRIIVYNAPADETGQTTLDEFARIASDDEAVSINSSYGACENDVGLGMAKAENVIFEQMALQGQSMFVASGDDGAFDCIPTDGSTVVNVDDPGVQPWVTDVGGTSLESDNPGMKAHPAYPPAGTETVWNPQGLCNTSADEGGQPGLTWCGLTGGSGGGSSQFWRAPFYQHGPGVDSSVATHGNGTTQCSLAPAGAPCRQVPDISATADQYTPYAEFCTGNDDTPNSSCGSFSQFETPPGWFGDGGTSLSSPLWSAIAADRDSYQGHRTGNFNPLLYQLLRTDSRGFFHDITGAGPLQAVSHNNGLFEATPGYDEATGIGTPRMRALITGTP